MLLTEHVPRGTIPTLLTGQINKVMFVVWRTVNGGAKEPESELNKQPKVERVKTGEELYR